MTDQPSPFDPAPLPAATPAPEKPKRRQGAKRGRPVTAKTKIETVPTAPKRRGRSPVPRPKYRVP